MNLNRSTFIYDSLMNDLHGTFYHKYPESGNEIEFMPVTNAIVGRQTDGRHVVYFPDGQLEVIR